MRAEDLGIPELGFRVGLGLRDSGEVAEGVDIRVLGGGFGTCVLGCRLWGRRDLGSSIGFRIGGLPQPGGPNVDPKIWTKPSLLITRIVLLKP